MVSTPTTRHWSLRQISRRSSRIEVLLGGASTRSLVVKKQKASIRKATTESTAMPPWKPSALSSPPIKLTSGIISTVESMPPAVASTKRQDCSEMRCVGLSVITPPSAQ
ncbi:Uncharacterised protein [Klebsiella pneumoniae]|nr:Uncharacterised protein [Klebsiella pneumoniae]